MATNLDSHFLSAKYCLPTMRKKKWGRLVGISSNMVGLAIAGMSHYIASKMGIIGFMRGLANDVASDGITANAVSPGLTNTVATAPQSEEQKRATWEQQAMKQLGEPQDITGAILFLTSGDAAFSRLGTGDRGRAGCVLRGFDVKRRLWLARSRRLVAFSTLLATELRAGIGGLAEPCGWWGSGLLCGFVDIYAVRWFGEPGLAQTIAASLSCEARARRRSFRLEGRRRRRAGCMLRRVDVYWRSSCL